MSKTIDMTGYKTGEITVIERAGSKGGQAAWLCKCSCGKTFIQYGSALRSGKLKSCGHILRDKSERAKIAHKTIARIKHGDCAERLYFVWIDIRRRCDSPRDVSYQNYGARGIKVCDEWNSDYLAFKRWAIANGYNPKAKRGECTIDRIDPNGNYSPDNCRWVTMKVQSNNKRNTIKLTYNGVTHSLSEWSDITGIPRSRLYQRFKYNWGAGRILDPVDNRTTN